MIFSNGRQESAQWPWPGKRDVELSDIDWPRQWEYCGVAREIRYTSDKIMPVDNPDGKVEEYLHDTAIGQGLSTGESKFRRLEPFVEVYAPRGSCPVGKPANVTEISRRSFAKSNQPRFPEHLAFLAQCDGWSISPPGVRAPCGPSKAYEAVIRDCILCCSPEGDMLCIIDLAEREVVSVWCGPTLCVGEEGIDD